MKFRKKPVIVDAVKWTGGNYKEICEFVGMYLSRSYVLGSTEIHIPTLEGVMTAIEGDWIIKGVNGEFYPVKKDIFIKTYDRVDDE